MSEGSWLECGATRTFTSSSFLNGTLEFPIDVQPGAGWIPSKSYVRIGLTLNGSGAAQPTLSQMVALADNAAGNLFSAATVRVGQREISSMSSDIAQASALQARLEHGSAWLDSVGIGSGLNIAKFSERNMLTASDSSPDAYLGADNEMYHPVDPDHFIDATVSITELKGNVIQAEPDGGGAAITVVEFPILQNGGIVTGIDVDFNTGMRLPVLIHFRSLENNHDVVEKSTQDKKR